MDRKLIGWTLFSYSLTNLVTYCAIAYSDARGGFLLILLLGMVVIALIGFMNYIKLVKAGWQVDNMYFEPSNLVIGLAPALYFGSCYLVGIISGIYLGWGI